jgi:hypothetical protein
MTSSFHVFGIERDKPYLPYATFLSAGEKLARSSCLSRNFCFCGSYDARGQKFEQFLIISKLNAWS